MGKILKFIAIGVVGLLVVGFLTYQYSDSAKKLVQLQALDTVHDLATSRMKKQAENGSTSVAAEFINFPIEATEVAKGVIRVTGIGNIYMVPTDAGNVLFDTGLVMQVPKQIAAMKAAVPNNKLTHIVLSHSHADHIGGVKYWKEDGVEIIAHDQFTEEQRYLKALEPYLHGRNRLLFPFMPEEPPTADMIAYGGITPTLTIKEGDSYRLELGGKVMDIYAMAGAEGADNMVMWLPEQKVLLSGDFFGPMFPQFPNVFTMRGEKIRKPAEYIRSLNRLIDLAPEVILPGHLDPVTGQEKIVAGLTKMRDAVQYVHDETIAGMNSGKTLYELMETITLPPELDLSQAHGRVSWAVKSIWEYYATWFHFDRTTELYGVDRGDVMPDVVALAGATALLEKARTFNTADQPVHAMHIIEILLADPMQASDPMVNQVRLETLQILLDKAVNGIENSYEIYWLNAQIREAEALLAGNENSPEG
ncbi:alkyl sulfatase-like hydrolase [alpha proteobacterium IMCC14465]|uniref:Alkyl sulfatase-like hydrolase n=1 Tax=alpha proteobacterium IMCC14465 TaxID=1220535 RepID=J9DE92_9PROT|nr:alkyl sulfatase-like hydrolase [alpha proteobacterium IMCC14465]